MNEMYFLISQRALQDAVSLLASVCVHWDLKRLSALKVSTE